MTNSIDRIKSRETLIDLKDYLIVYHNREGVRDDLIYKIQIGKLLGSIANGGITGGYIDIGARQLVLTSPSGNIIIDITSLVSNLQVTGAFSNQTEYTLIHNFGRYAKVTVLDTSGKEQIGFPIHHTTNQVTLRSNIPFSGTIICN